MIMEFRCESFVIVLNYFIEISHLFPFKIPFKEGLQGDGSGQMSV